jgi:hypothetical protein
VSRKRADHDISKIAAAVVGAPITACLVGAALARVLPLSEGAAFAWGVHLIFPLWVGLAVALPLTRTGRRAWIICACVALPAVAALRLGKGAAPSSGTQLESAP